MSRESLKDCTTTITAMFLFKSWQRLGAEVKATLQEHHTSKVVKGETVIHVKEHKTGVTANAKLMLSAIDSSRLKAYVLLIRPQWDPEGQSEKLLVFPRVKSKKQSQLQVAEFGKKARM